MIEAMMPTTPQEPTVSNAAKRASGLLGLGEKIPNTPEGRHRRQIRALGVVGLPLALGLVLTFVPDGFIDRLNGPDYSPDLIEVPIVQPGQIVDGVGATDLYGVAEQVEQTGPFGPTTDSVIEHIEQMPQNKEALSNGQLDPGEVIVAPKEVSP